MSAKADNLPNDAEKERPLHLGSGRCGGAGFGNPSGGQ
jgi:hypothetical protein